MNKSSRSVQNSSEKFKWFAIFKTVSLYKIAMSEKLRKALRLTLARFLVVVFLNLTAWAVAGTAVRWTEAGNEIVHKCGENIAITNV